MGVWNFRSVFVSLNYQPPSEKGFQKRGPSLTYCVFLIKQNQWMSIRTVILPSGLKRSSLVRWTLYFPVIGIYLLFPSKLLFSNSKIKEISELLNAGILYFESSKESMVLYFKFSVCALLYRSSKSYTYNTYILLNFFSPLIYS